MLTLANFLKLDSDFLIPLGCLYGGNGSNRTKPISALLFVMENHISSKQI